MLTYFFFPRIHISAVYNCLGIPAVPDVFVRCLCHTFQQIKYDYDMIS